jgi:heterodisulfide reductase subunit C
MNTHDEKTDLIEAEQELEAIRKMVRPCMQCGSCAASCPNAFAMTVAPRELWRLLLMGFTQEALASGAFWMCSSCYTCTLRCPRGLPLTEAMAALKRLSAQYYPEYVKRNATFYATFMENIRRYGRVQETALMMRYFMSMGSPVLPLEFAPLGLRMLGKGKLHAPSSAQKGKLDALFKKAEPQGEHS